MVAEVGAAASIALTAANYGKTVFDAVTVSASAFGAVTGVAVTVAAFAGAKAAVRARRHVLGDARVSDCKGDYRPGSILPAFITPVSTGIAVLVSSGMSLGPIATGSATVLGGVVGTALTGVVRGWVADYRAWRTPASAAKERAAAGTERQHARADFMVGAPAAFAFAVVGLDPVITGFATMLGHLARREGEEASVADAAATLERVARQLQDLQVRVRGLRYELWYAQTRTKLAEQDIGGAIRGTSRVEWSMICAVLVDVVDRIETAAQLLGLADDELEQLRGSL